VSQALAAGKPVVAYDCDGAGEVCLDGKTGFLVPAGDIGLLRRRLTQLLESPLLREALGRAGQAMVRELFPVERMVDELATLYRELAAKHLSGAPR
jgi:glycosyltransferase involved in cell wall biosynthesis